MIRRASVLAVLPAAVLAVLLLVRFRRTSVARFNRAVANQTYGRDSVSGRQARPEPRPSG